MSFSVNNKLKIVVTTRDLFQLEDENKIFEEEGKEAYETYQIEKEKEILNPEQPFL